MFSQFKDRVARRNKTSNGQSISQHNRLSKPRTNTNSKPASPAISNEIPSSGSSRYANPSVRNRQKTRDLMLSPINKDPGSAIWSDHDICDVETVVEGRGRRSTNVSRSNSRAHSRSGSMLRSFGRSRRNSTVNLNGLPDSKTSLTSTTQADIEAAIRLLQQVKKNASPEELAALREALECPTESVPTSELELDRLSPEISGILTRRKSLVQIPGVATRTSPVEGQRRTWNSWKAPQMRPKDEAKWRAPRREPSPSECLVALDLADNGHAHTPGELEYSHLGTFKPGTLMVVNGAVSPAPSTINLECITQTNENNDYFSATESSHSPLTAKSDRKQAHVRSRSSTGVRDNKANFFSDLAVEEKIPITYIKPEVKPKRRPQNIYTNIRRSSQGADTLANGYQAYTPYSPFENRMVTHNIWQGQEATTDELFFENLQHRSHRDNLVELPATITDVTELSPPSTATSTNTLETSKCRTLRPSPRTSDSGYSSIGSSGSSLRSANRDQQYSALRMATQASHDSPRIVYSTRKRQTASAELPVQEVFSTPFEQSLLATVPKHTHGRTMSLDIPRGVAELPSMDPVLTPSTLQSETSRHPENPPPRPVRRLQKRRRSQPPLPIVQSVQPSRGVIPEVPDDVRVKFTRRLSITPGMECLTHTYPSKEHTISAEPTASFNSIEPVSSPTQLEPDHTLMMPARDRRRSLSFFRRKSMAGKKEDGQEGIHSPKVLDFGTIAVSLGASPYDPSAFESLRRDLVANPTYPHQLGQARSRSRSAVSMSSDTAAEYARMRSKDRALPESEMPEMPQHRKPRWKPKMEIGEAKQLKRHSQTFCIDEAPPMPNIDHSLYPAPLSAKPRLENANVPAANQSRIRTNSRPQSPLRPSHTRPPSAHKNIDWEHTLNWEQHALQWSQRRQSIGESLGPRPTFEAKENTAPAPCPRPTSYTSQELNTFGRFSGGLGYDHEGRGQIGGSAGTRELHSYATPKSMHFKQAYGVDLSDVPIFVQRQ